MEILQLISNVLLIIFLGVAAYFDAKNKEISIIIPTVGFTCGFVLQLIAGEMKIYEIIGGCILGVIFLLIAKLTNEAIGYGDGMILVATGAFLGIVGNVILLMISLLIALLFSLAMLILKKMKRKSGLPFIPFMLGGFVAMLAFY